MKEKFTRLWNLGSGFEMLHIGNGYFTVKFDSKEDRTKVIQEGPWIIFDHYLMVKTWTRNSVFPKAKIQKTMVWICFPSLNFFAMMKASYWH